MAKTPTKKTKGGKASADARLKITLVKSTIGFNRDQAKVVQGIGLRRIGHSVELSDTPATRGMILKVRHLVTVERAS
jgi:large subunit ribosomal protein L30